MTYKEKLNQIKTIIETIKTKIESVNDINFVTYNMSDFFKSNYELPAVFIKYEESNFSGYRETDEDITIITIYIKNKNADELKNLSILADISEKFEDYSIDNTCKGAYISNIQNGFDGIDTQKNILSEIRLNVYI